MAPGINRLTALKFVSGPDLFFLMSFIHLVLKWANIFKGHLGPWSEHFVGPHQILKAHGPEGLPYFNPWKLFIFLVLISHKGVVWHTGIRFLLCGRSQVQYLVGPFVKDLKTYSLPHLFGIKYWLNIRIHTTPVARRVDYVLKHLVFHQCRWPVVVRKFGLPISCLPW